MPLKNTHRMDAISTLMTAIQLEILQKSRAHSSERKQESLTPF